MLITEIFPCYSYHINLGYNVTLFALNSVPDTSSYPVMIDQDLEGVSQFLPGYFLKGKTINKYIGDILSQFLTGYLRRVWLEDCIRAEISQFLGGYLSIARGLLGWRPYRLSQFLGGYLARPAAPGAAASTLNSLADTCTT